MSPLNHINGTWDPSLLRLNEGEAARSQGATRRVSRPTVKNKFIAGPIDVHWVCRASGLGVKALLVGLALWHLKGLRKADAFILSNLMLRDWGILPDAKWRALRKLEVAGLIRIERCGKRSPRVTIVVGNGAEKPDKPRGYSDRSILAVAPGDPDANCVKEAA
jgi:hypothetical protein